ncbi:MAG TPA: hypothetical protein VKR31_00015 [Rhizomicrobium sp.]|nr:hypothetical protein [Rhizomicrobium sp.]
MHRWRSALLLMWTIAVLTPLTGTPRLLAADPLSTIADGEPGGAEVKGRAVFTRADGTTHTCRYGEAVLVPANSRSRNVVQSFFGGTTEGHIRETNYRNLLEQIGPDAVRADCDKDGRFAFGNVKAGSYFILGRTLWFNRWAHDGQILMRSVEIADAGEVDVFLQFPENP